MAHLGLQIGMLCEKLSNLRLDRLGQQRTRTAAQDLREGIGEGPWLGELDDVTVGHGVSLLHWRSGGVEHHNDTPPYPVTPSPTSGHSSLEGERKIYERDADSGNRIRFHFCPNCGSTLYWEGDGNPAVCGVAVGAFDVEAFPSPSDSIWEESMHRWLGLPPATEHHQRGRPPVS